MSSSLSDLTILHRRKGKSKKPKATGARHNVNAAINRHFIVRSKAPSGKADLMQMLADAAANTATMQKENGE